jgi:signal transduction histidine kinase
MMDALYQFPLFEGVSDDEIRWLIDHSHEETLQDGDFFFRENGPADRFGIVLEGELQASRMVDGREIIMGTTPRGIMGGEIPLLNRIPANINARAIMPCRLMVFDEQAFREIFTACPVVGMRILQTATERMQRTASILKQQEKMAALGKLAAGLAHELNNPASAARRAAKTLWEAFPDLQAQTLQISTLGLSDPEVAALVAFQEQVIGQAANARTLSPIEQSNREDEIADWLDSLDISGGWDVAPAFVSAGITLDDLDAFAGQFAPDKLGGIVVWLRGMLDASALLNEIEQSTQRISELVGAVKSYTYMDHAPEQEVDLHAGLDNTLTVMKYKLRGVDVVREYDPHLPTIVARGSELNQVWTNLIDNAIDAMYGQGQITLITRHEADYVMVEITDDGPGIPEDVLPRIFEPFFTTKEVGVGTGLGLDISYRIIQQHNGTLEVQSQPGLTRFIIRLPIRAANHNGT